MSIVCSLFTICQIELFSWSGDGGVLHRPGTSVCASVFPVLLCLAVHAVVGIGGSEHFPCYCCVTSSLAFIAICLTSLVEAMSTREECVQVGR